MNSSPAKSYQTASLAEIQMCQLFCGEGKMFPLKFVFLRMPLFSYQQTVSQNKLKLLQGSMSSPDIWGNNTKYIQWHSLP